MLAILHTLKQLWIYFMQWTIEILKSTGTCHPNDTITWSAWWQFCPSFLDARHRRRQQSCTSARMVEPGEALRGHLPGHTHAQSAQIIRRIRMPSRLNAVSHRRHRHNRNLRDFFQDRLLRHYDTRKWSTATVYIILICKRGTLYIQNWVLHV